MLQVTPANPNNLNKTESGDSARPHRKSLAFFVTRTETQQLCCEHTQTVLHLVTPNTCYWITSYFF